MISREEIEKLAALSRLKISDAEADALASDFASILEYVSKIQSATIPSDMVMDYGEVNVFREDVNPDESGIYSDAILAQAPDRDGRYIRVPKILP